MILVRHIPFLKAVFFSQHLCFWGAAGTLRYDVENVCTRPA